MNSLCGACTYLRCLRAITCDIGFALFSCRPAVIRVVRSVVRYRSAPSGVLAVCALRRGAQRLAHLPRAFLPRAFVSSPRAGRGPRRVDHFAHQRQQCLPLLQVKRIAPGHLAEQCLLELVLHLEARWGENQILDPAVSGVRLAPGKPTLLERVSDHGDERRVAVHALAEFLHGHGRVEPVHCLGAEHGHAELLRYLLGAMHRVGHQLGQGVEDVLVQLVASWTPGHCCLLPPCRSARRLRWFCLRAWLSSLDAGSGHLVFRVFLGAPCLARLPCSAYLVFLKTRYVPQQLSSSNLCHIA